MRKAIFCSLLLTAAVPVYGDQRPPAPVEQKQQAFTDDEKRQALEALKAIAGQFQTQTPPTAQQAPADKKDDHKTMADVADKALDISTKYIGQVVAVLEKVAPHVWRVMVMQQYAKGIGGVIAPFMWMLMFPFVAVFVRHFWRVRVTPDEVVVQDGKTVTIPHNCRKHNCTDCMDNDEKAWRQGLTAFLPAVCTCIAGGFFISALADSAMYLINPEYYAIKDLINLLLHGGM